MITLSTKTSSAPRGESISSPCPEWMLSSFLGSWPYHSNFCFHYHAAFSYSIFSVTFSPSWQHFCWYNILKNLIWVTQAGLSSRSCQACSLNSADLDCLFWITGLFLSFLPSSTRPGLVTLQEKQSSSPEAGTRGREK